MKTRTPQSAVAERVGLSLLKVLSVFGRHTCLQIVMQNVTQPMGIAPILIAVHTSDEKQCLTNTGTSTFPSYLF